MKQKAQRKRWLGLMLVLFLYLTGVCGADTSFSCTCISGQAERMALVQTAETLEYAVRMPVEQLYRNSLVQLPDVMQPAERLYQSRGDLLEQGKPERRSGGRYVEKVNDRTQEPLRGLAAVCYSRETTETAASFCLNRIIAYIHDQDGYKGNIL